MRKYFTYICIGLFLSLSLPACSQKGCPMNQQMSKRQIKKNKKNKGHTGGLWDKKMEKRRR